ncbi:MAG TPA: hypothetical protein VN612_10875 [Acidobacteriaceae bacterium]|nr:hypothetical protein [Acidobacteriaceae bacterium]
MSAARYQQIQDLREPRTKRSEFRSHAKLPFRPMTKVNGPKPPRKTWRQWLGEQMQIPEAHETRWLLVFNGVLILLAVGLWVAK